MIYDQNQNRIILRCPIPDHHEIEKITWIGGTSFVAYYVDEGDDRIGKVYLLNIETGMFTIIADNVTEFVGWSGYFGE